MYAFDDDRALLRTAPGAFHGDVSPRWNVGSVPNGGYVLGLAMAALEQEFAGLDPLTVTAHYLRPAAVGPVDVTVETLKRGRSYSTATVALRQADKEVVRVLATYGLLEESGTTPTFVDAVPPGGDREQTPPRDWPPDLAPEIAKRFDIRFNPPEAPPGTRAELRGWIRFADRRPMDVHCLGLIADAFPPPVFLVTERGWVPTIELTVHVRARPTSEWLNCSFRTRFMVGGLLEEDGEIWDESGRLVALTRQLAARPRLA